MIVKVVVVLIRNLKRLLLCKKPITIWSWSKETLCWRLDDNKSVIFQ